MQVQAWFSLSLRSQQNLNLHLTNNCDTQLFVKCKFKSQNHNSEIASDTDDTFEA